MVAAARRSTGAPDTGSQDPDQIERGDLEAADHGLEQQADQDRYQPELRIRRELEHHPCDGEASERRACPRSTAPARPHPACLSGRNDPR